MRTTQQYSITLPRDMARLIEKKIESGAYATVSEVLREGVRTLADRDAVLEKWLRTEAMESYKQYKRNPDSGIPLKKAFARLRKKAKARRSAKRR
jgi:putative addiction module CopG family antidote